MGEVEVEVGGVLSMEASSAGVSCQIRRRLSRPWVMIRSGPHDPRPRMELVWERQTATGRLEVRFQEITQPSASPVRRRALLGVKWTAWIWAE